MACHGLKWSGDGESRRSGRRGAARLACVFAMASWSVASLTHKELVHRSVATQWPFLVQFVCFSFDISGASHATHSEPSRLTSWFGGSPAHNKSHGQRRTFVHNAPAVLRARTATLDAGLLVVRRHLAWLALFTRACVPRPALRSQRLFEVRCPARKERRLVADGPVNNRRRKCGRCEGASRVRRPGM